MAEQTIRGLSAHEHTYIREHSQPPVTYTHPITYTPEFWSEWTAEGDSKYSRVAAVAFPRTTYYVFEVLKDGEWVEDKQKWQESLERAIPVAQTLANRLMMPVRIKEVIDI